MKVGDLIKVCTEGAETANLWCTGLLIRIEKWTNHPRRVAIVLTERGIDKWPLDSHYEYEVISESR